MLRYHSGQFGKHALYITFSLIVFLQMTLAHYNHGVKIHNWASVENIFVWSIAWRYHYTTRVFDKYLTTCGFNFCYIQRVYIFKVLYKFLSHAYHAIALYLRSMLFYRIIFIDTRCSCWLQSLGSRLAAVMHPRNTWEESLGTWSHRSKCL